jgi:hypothetical protein
VVGQDPQATNIDIAASYNDRYMYTLNAAAGTIRMSSVQDDGSPLSPGQQDGLPPSAGINGKAPANHWAGCAAWDVTTFFA